MDESRQREGALAPAAAEDEIFQGEPVRPREVGTTPIGSRMRLRFGIGGIMILVTVLAVQYTLVRYVGPIGAMVIAPLVCSLLVAVVVGAELMAWRRPEGQAQSLGRRAFTWVIGYIFLLGISAALAGGGQIGYQWYAQWRLERRIQRDLGFTYTPGIVWKTNQPRGRKAVFLLFVEPGGPFGQGGLSSGEAVVSDLPPADWFRMLDENRGRRVDVVVARGAATTALDKCTQRTATIYVPP